MLRGTKDACGLPNIAFKGKNRCQRYATVRSARRASPLKAVFHFINGHGRHENILLPLLLDHKSPKSTLKFSHAANLTAMLQPILISCFIRQSAIAQYSQSWTKKTLRRRCAITATVLAVRSLIRNNSPDFNMVFRISSKKVKIFTGPLVKACCPPSLSQPALATGDRTHETRCTSTNPRINGAKVVQLLQITDVHRNTASA